MAWEFLVEACGIPTRDQTCTPCIGRPVLAAGPPETYPALDWFSVSPRPSEAQGDQSSLSPLPTCRTPRGDASATDCGPQDPRTHHCAVFHLCPHGLNRLSRKGPRLQLQIHIAGLSLLGSLWWTGVQGLEPREARVPASICPSPLRSGCPSLPILPFPSPSQVLSGECLNGQVNSWAGGPSAPPPCLEGNRLARAHGDPATRPPRRCSSSSK